MNLTGQITLLLRKPRDGDGDAGEGIAGPGLLRIAPYRSRKNAKRGRDHDHYVLEVVEVVEIHDR